MGNLYLGSTLVMMILANEINVSNFKKPQFVGFETIFAATVYQ